MPTFEELKQSDSENLWKALNGLIAVAPFSVDALTKSDIFSADGKSLKPLPEGYLQLGRVTEDMFSWGREIEASEVRSGGESEPGRTDIKSVTKSLTTTVQEVNKTTLELIKGIDLTAVKAGLADGVVEIVEPDRPRMRYYRVVVFAADEGELGERYRVRQFTRSRVTETGDETWQNEDDSMSTELTFSAFKDQLLGTSTMEWIGGNWSPTKAGFEVATA
jgi:hypothetical protein